MVSDRVAYLPSIVAACSYRSASPSAEAAAPRLHLTKNSTRTIRPQAATTTRRRPKRKNGTVPKSGLAKLAGALLRRAVVRCAGLQALRTHVRAQPYANELALLRAATRGGARRRRELVALGDASGRLKRTSPGSARRTRRRRTRRPSTPVWNRSPAGCWRCGRGPCLRVSRGATSSARTFLGGGLMMVFLQLFEAAKWHTRGGDFKKATRNLLRVKKLCRGIRNCGAVWAGAEGRGETGACVVEAYERAVELDPACVEAYQNWGNLELGRENRPRALELFRRELELDPSHRSRFENYASDPDIQALLKGPSRSGPSRRRSSLRRTRPIRGLGRKLVRV